MRRHGTSGGKGKEKKRKRKRKKNGGDGERAKVGEIEQAKKSNFSSFGQRR